jgi:hypothetical protein
MGGLQEIIESRQSPGFLGLTDGHGAVRQIKSDRLKEKVKEQLWKRRNRNEKLNPESLPL